MPAYLLLLLSLGCATEPYPNAKGLSGLFDGPVRLPEDSGAAPDSGTPDTGDTGSDSADTDEPPPEGPTLIAGFRASSYGGAPFPEPDYWQEVASQMAARFDGATPGGVWIVGVTGDDGTCNLSFPSPGGAYDDIAFADDDENEAALTAFDRAGVKVWLQVESGDAGVSELISLVMDRYGHHESVVGFGVDVEWFRWNNNPDGKPIEDDNARTWVDAIRAYDPDDTLFLKHWMTDRMPPTERDGIVFVNDGMGVGSLSELVGYFEDWGAYFAPSPVGFQFGYDEDRDWWADYDDPASAIGDETLRRVPNTEALFWVDFTATDVFPQ